VRYNDLKILNRKKAFTLGAFAALIGTTIMMVINKRNSSFTLYYSSWMKAQGNLFIHLQLLLVSDSPFL